MILKIRTASEYHDGWDWIYIGRIAKIRVTLFGSKDRENIKGIKYDIQYINPKASEIYTSMAVVMDNGIEKLILANDEKYLLNNEGKTIEKL